MNLFLLVLIIVLNAARFFGLDTSPPGFYVDEAAGAAHVICLQQGGSDFYNHAYPLFSAGFSGGFYTPAFLYGEYLWTSLFGHSVSAFRSFSALVTALTILFLCLWVRGRERGPEVMEGCNRLALWVALAASVMPWAFQFSRIAWDPPLSVLFLVMALWASGRMDNLHSRVMPGVFLALAAYSYPPMRVVTVAFWLLLPGRRWRAKLLDMVLFVVVCLPLFILAFEPGFTARGRELMLWSDNTGNPYAHSDLITLFGVFMQQMMAHFSVSFLFLSGDANLRHSIQTSGMLSWLDAFAWLSAIVVVFSLIVKRQVWNGWPDKNIFIISLLGVLFAIVPAALTWEGVPHALRSIAAWPFFALLTGALLAGVDAYLRRQGAWLHSLWLGTVLLIAVGFFGFYLKHYFTEYPVAAISWFQSESTPLAQAYPRMMDNTPRCLDLPR